jgi:phage shock protein B
MDVFVFLLSLIGLIMFFLYKMVSIGVRRRDERYNLEDTEMIQQLNRNLEKMERRIETLETLLIEKADLHEPHTFSEVMQQRRTP